MDKELILDSIVLDNVQDIFVDANGVINYVDEEGIVQPIEDADEKTEIISASGERFVVNSDNEIMSKDLFVKTKGGTKNKLKQINQSKDESVDPTQLASVVFSQIKNSKYGFDTYQAVYASLANQYQSLKFREKYPVHWKYISSFATDKVKVNHSKDIVFKNDLGIKQIKQKNQVVLRGGADGIETAIYAYQQNTKDSTETVVGKLKVISYSEKTKKIALVSVNGFSAPSGIEAELNRVYKQAGINWTVTGKHSIQVIFDDGYFNHGGSGVAACYNQDQKLLIKTLKETTNIDKDTYYLFFIKDVKDKGRASSPME